MKKILCALLIVSLLSPAFSENTPTPEPYTEEEFPSYLHSLRRAEIVSLGSVPFIMFTLSISLMIVKGFTSAKGTGKSFVFGAPLSEKEQFALLGSSIGLGVCVGLCDFVIFRHKEKIRMAREKEKKDEAALGVEIKKQNEKGTGKGGSDAEKKEDGTEEKDGKHRKRIKNRGAKRRRHEKKKITDASKNSNGTKEDGIDLKKNSDGIEKGAMDSKKNPDGTGKDLEMAS